MHFCHDQLVFPDDSNQYANKKIYINFECVGTIKILSKGLKYLEVHLNVVSYRIQKGQSTRQGAYRWGLLTVCISLMYVNGNEVFCFEITASWKSRDFRRIYFLFLLRNLRNMKNNVRIIVLSISVNKNVTRYYTKYSRCYIFTSQVLLTAIFFIRCEEVVRNIRRSTYKWRSHICIITSSSIVCMG